MEAISWNDGYSVKIELIDDQHKKLFKLINEFYNHITTDVQHEHIKKLIAGMFEYTVMHFSTEERYMKQFNFPGFAEHKKEHEEFIEKVRVLEEKLVNGNKIMSLEVTNYVRDWIKKHINDTDKKYSDFLIQHGVK